MYRRFALMIGSALVLASLMAAATWDASEAREESTRVRRTAVAGIFYPAQRDELRTTVQDSLETASELRVTHPIKAVLAPHAGYRYCKHILAASFAQVMGDRFHYDTVVLIGASHRVPTEAAALSSATAWETPLGLVPVDTSICHRLVESHERITFDDRPHSREHSLEVLLPYLMTVAKDRPFTIVPMVTSSSDPNDHRIVAKALARTIDMQRTLLVVSSDLSHFPTAEVAEQVDRKILAAVETLNPLAVRTANKEILGRNYQNLSCTMCGLGAVQCLINGARELGIDQARVVTIGHSGSTSGDSDRVVGYASMIFTGKQGTRNAFAKSPIPSGLDFDQQSRSELLQMARKAVEAAVKNERMELEPSSNPALQIPAGCFVTLRNRGRLRGCIGTLSSDAPLWKTVQTMGAAAATMDRRFVKKPVRERELADIDLEISVLSPLQQVEDPVREIQLGRHGIVVRDENGRGGTYLPQVAEETGWTVEEFLGHCSHDKAGLAWDGWTKPSAQVYTFTAKVIR